MYYIVNAAGRTEGPYPAEWVRAHALGRTLVSHQQKWIPFSAHPDFRNGPVRCRNCRTENRAALRFCTACGQALSADPRLFMPSPHRALLSLIVPGLGQMALGQFRKGIVVALIWAISFVTAVGPLLVYLAAIADGYLVAGKFRRTGSVGAWELFPN